MGQMSYRPGACLMYPCIACGQMDAEPAWMIMLRPIATNSYGSQDLITEPYTLHDGCLYAAILDYGRTKTLSPLLRTILRMWLC